MDGWIRTNGILAGMHRRRPCGIVFPRHAADRRSDGDRLAVTAYFDAFAAYPVAEMRLQRQAGVYTRAAAKRCRGTDQL